MPRPEVMTRSGLIGLMGLPLLPALLLGTACRPEDCMGGGTDSCASPTPGLRSQAQPADAPTKNLYFRNAAAHVAELFRVDESGDEARASRERPADACAVTHRARAAAGHLWPHVSGHSARGAGDGGGGVASTRGAAWPPRRRPADGRALRRPCAPARLRVSAARVRRLRQAALQGPAPILRPCRLRQRGGRAARPVLLERDVRGARIVAPHRRRAGAGDHPAIEMARIPARALTFPPLCRSPAYACRSSRRRGTPCARAPRAPTGDS